MEAQRDDQWVQAARTVRERGEAREQARTETTARVVCTTGDKGCQGLSPLQTSSLLASRSLVT